MTVDDLVGKLLAIDDLRNTSEQPNQEEIAMYTQGKKRQQFRQHKSSTHEDRADKEGGEKKFQFKCYKCHETGHKASECPSKGLKWGTGKEKGKFKTRTGAMMSMAGERPIVGKWYIDSCCSNHVSPDKKCMTEFTQETPSIAITVANNQVMESKGKGNVPIMLKGSDDARELSNVLYVPDATANLLSVSNTVKKGYCMFFSADKGCQIFNSKGCRVTGTIVGTAKDVGGIYELEVEDKLKCYAISQPKANRANIQSPALWHQRLVHLNAADMLKLRKIDCGVNFPDSENKLDCIPCVTGKLARQPFPLSESRSSKRLELVHADLCGPLEERSFSGSRYVLLLKDDYSRKMFGYFLATKSDVFKHFKEFTLRAEIETGEKLKCIRTDNGTEFCNKQMNEFLAERGIKHERTVIFCPEQNGRIERSNRTVIETARTLLEGGGLHKRYWAEAVNTAIYVRNRCPSKAVSGKIPEELWRQKRISLSHLRVFGCEAYAHIPKQKRRKLDPKSEKKIFVGYSESSKAYRLLDTDHKGNLTIAKTVVFFENKFPGKLVDDSKPTPDPLPIVSEFHSKDPDDMEEANVQDKSGSEDSRSTTTVDSEDHDIPLVEEGGSRQDQAGEDTQVRRYPLRKRTPRVFPDHVMYSAVQCDQEPEDIEQALKCADSDKWIEAINEELDALKSNEAWDLVNLPPGEKAVGNKWVFKIKHDSEGKITKHKARLVAKGFTQTYGFNYTETFSPLVRYSTLRLLLSLAIQLDWKIDHWDIVTAFLHGPLKENVYMVPPYGLNATDVKGKVCKLRTGLYGLKQSSRIWYEQLHSELCKYDFRQCEFEPCVYTKSSEKGVVIVAIYVDDIFVFYSNTVEMQKLRKALSNEFPVKNLGAAKNILGMRVERSNNVITLDQSNYIRNVLDKFSMQDSKPARTPLVTGTQLEKGVCDTSFPYQRLVGCLMYIGVCTRPDMLSVCYLVLTLAMEKCMSELPREYYDTRKGLLTLS